MRMPFGQFKGQPVASLPDDYLAWLRGIAKGPLRQAVEAEFAARCAEEDEEPRHSWNHSPTLPADVATMADKIVSAGYRTVARSCHPDTGGTHDAMLLANRAAQWLRDAVHDRT